MRRLKARHDLFIEVMRPLRCPDSARRIPSLKVAPVAQEGLVKRRRIAILSVWTPERAHRMFKEIIANFEEPPMDPAIREELAAFVARRKEEGGAPTDF